LQGEHDATFEVMEYCPAGHKIQLVAPTLTPVSVLDPGGHRVHDVTFEGLEYCPTVHAMQVAILDPLARHPPPT
jgi:hypothetical protein